MRVGLKGAFALFALGIILGYLLQPVLLEGGKIDSIAENEGLSLGYASLYICPEDECSEQLIEFIGSAQKSVHVMIYSLTKEEIAEALVDAKEKGLDVGVIMDNVQASGAYSKDEYLIRMGVPVRIVDLSGYAVMHHKVTIVDGSAFSTGSFNYSKNADSGNAENLLIVRNDEFAQRMEGEFERYWSE